jgi:hypothetical protein
MSRRGQPRLRRSDPWKILGEGNDHPDEVILSRRVPAYTTRVHRPGGAVAEPPHPGPDRRVGEPVRGDSR